jgi:dTDP-4-dehydrorhamnose 3,5-epimerase
VLLTTEVQTPVAAASRLDVDLSSIMEHEPTLAATGGKHVFTLQAMGKGRNGPRLATDELTEVAARDRPTVDAHGRELGESLEDVIFQRLAPLADHRGSLVPFLDTRDLFWTEPVVYAYEIMIRPGRIKGWGMHEQQTDRYFVAAGNVRIALYDGRPDRGSHGRIAQFFFTDATPGLLAIPPGVWHADQNWGKTDARIVNFPTHPYDPADPDKLRIDPHSDVIPFDWELRDG